MTPLMTFTAQTVPGVKRGRKIGYPTVNLEVADIPSNVPHGIYAVRVSGDVPAVAHYGAHPAFKDARVTFEVHCLDKCNAARRSRAADVTLAGVLTVEIVQKIRDVQDFSDVEALRKQIAKDCATARAILGSP